MKKTKLFSLKSRSGKHLESRPLKNSVWKSKARGAIGAGCRSTSLVILKERSRSRNKAGSR